jgi:signal transduction histidine kinase
MAMKTDLGPSQLRKTGISVIGDVRWGTHFCCFYETKQDLLDTLVLFFKAGLENSEFCLWVVSPPLTVEEAKRALGQAVSDLDGQFAERGLEIRDYSEWYLHNGQFDPQRVLQGWREKLTQASAMGYAGMRASGDTAWIPKDDWSVFHKYEEALAALVADERRIILCTYPLTTSPGDHIFDVARVHQMAVARRHGSWEMIETPELKQTKAELAKRKENLEHRVVERTTELEKTNELLKREIEDRKRAESKLTQREEYLRVLLKNVPVAVYTCNQEGLIEYYNPKAVEMWGRATVLRDTMHKYCGSFALYHTDGTPMPFEESVMAQVIRTGIPQRNQEVVIERPDGTRVTALVNVAPLRNERGEPIGAVNCLLDISGRKQAEEALKNSHAQLRAFSGRLQSVREGEAARIAREIHDELGQTLTGLKMQLRRAERKLEELQSSSVVNSLLDTLVSATELVDGITATVQGIAADLRPGVLDKLGLGAALHYEGRRFQERTGIVCEVHLPETELNLSGEAATALFRIFQECLTNITRHAHAIKVEAALKLEDGRVTLRVQDNGRGITEAEIANPKSLGLLGMKERTSLLGGEIVFRRGPQGGTSVIARIPQKGTSVQTRAPV